jgi:hypothetical protein
MPRRQSVTVPAPAGTSSSRPRPAAIDTRALLPQRSSTRLPEDSQYASSSMQRRNTTRGAPTYDMSSHGSANMPHAALMPSPVFPNDGFAPPSPVFPQGPYMMAPGYSSGLQPSSSLPSGAQYSSRAERYQSVQSPTDYHNAQKAAAHMSLSSQVPPPAGPSVSRKTTGASRHPSDPIPHPSRSHQEHAPHGARHPDSHTLSREATTSRSSDAKREPGRKVTLRVEGSAQRIEVEVWATTNVKEVLHRAKTELESAGKERAWVLCELFGEGGCGEYLAKNS